MGDFDLAVKSITIAPGSYTYAANTASNYVYSYSNIVTAPYGASYTPPVPDTPEKWLRQRIKEVCELAAA